MGRSGSISEMKVRARSNYQSLGGSDMYVLHAFGEPAVLLQAFASWS